MFLFGDFRFAQLVVELFLFDLFQLVQQWSVECQRFENRRIFSILRQVHPSERVASSAQVLLEGTWET